MPCKRVKQPFHYKGPCPIFDLTNCPNPQEPLSCPILEQRPRRPCYRWICEATTQSSQSSETSTLMSEISSVLEAVASLGSPTLPSTPPTNTPRPQFL